ncbi:unnamed protein product [Echinostoma caproni]|uniref:Uncharacterized protein n=1 Tax=Echinostoma caproni TaxID=27848 RepID=A0A3P8KFP7_9TREM|nr:unnamed protein product [Echinostoma caproni]
MFSITVRERILEKLLLWVEAAPSKSNELHSRMRDQQRAHLLSLFETLMTQSRQNVIAEISVLRPLLQFLFKLSSQLRPAYSKVYGRTLYEFCVLLCRDSLFLDHCRKICEELFGQPHIVFSMLVPLIHQGDAVGDWAKDAFLLVLSVSKRDDALGNYLAFESDFCPVLATGLSGLYSSLPKKLVPRHELPNAQDLDSPGGPVTLTSAAFFEPLSSAPCVVELPVGGPSWHQLAENEWNQSTDLRRFLHTLDFCNLVIKICHQNVRDQLLYYINSGFLVPVLGSALHQSALDEVVAATAYLELFLRRLTEPTLIKLVLNFIVNGTYDSYSILTSLINRLNSKAALGMVTLSLFRTILSFHCEDVMYELVLKYLIPFYDAPVTTTSGDSSSQSPKMHHQSRWRPSRSQEDKPTTPHAVASNQLSLDLVRSGDRFMSLANTATPSKRFEVNTSQQVLRSSTEGVHNADPCEPLPLSRDRRSPASLSGVMERSAHSENGDVPNDWVLVQTRMADLNPPEKPFLFPYLRCTQRRIRRRREACSAWHSSYVSRTLDTSTTLTMTLTDKELELNEHRDRKDIHLSPQRPFTNQVCSPVREISSAVHMGNSGGDVRSNGDLDSPRPVRSATMSRAQASSLYQLNYFEDSSEEEAFSAKQQEIPGQNLRSRLSHLGSSSPSDSPGLSPTTNAYLPIKQNVTTEDSVCTCLTAAEANIVMEACSTPPRFESIHAQS